ncbi:MAG: hypothetical protein R3C20_11415 [Planctomycetaceae bacterium]
MPSSLCRPCRGHARGGTVEEKYDNAHATKYGPHNAYAIVEQRSRLGAGTRGS